MSRGAGWPRVLSAAVGALAAGTYAHFIGCRTGGCILLSSVWTAAVAGGLLGFVLSGGRPAPNTTETASKGEG